jgi:hypothetical protein
MDLMDPKVSLIANNKLASLFSNNVNAKARNTLKNHNLMIIYA